MTALHALPRLLWRPAMLLWLAFPILPSIAFTMSLLDESGVPVRTLWEGGGGEPALAAAWRLVLLAAAIGLGVSLARLEGEQTPLAWSLPGLRRGLLGGTLLVALAIAPALAFPVYRSAGSPAAYAAALGLAFFWFALGSALADRAFPLLARWSAILAILAAGFRPLALAELAAVWPWVVGAGGMLAAVALMLVQFSAPAARSRILTSFDREARYWTSRLLVDRRWTGSLATVRLLPWLRAAEYEGSRGAPLWFTVFIGPAIAVLWAHLTDQPSMALMLAALWLIHGRLLLSPPLLHPLSRRRHAALAVAGSALHAALFVLLMAAMVLAVEALGLPVLTWFSEPSPRHVGWVMVLLMTFAWSPVMLWGAVRWPDFIMMKSTAAAFKGIALMIPYVLVAQYSAWVLEGREPLVVLLGAAAISAVVWGLFTLAVRWHYARADLLPRPA